MDFIKFFGGILIVVSGTFGGIYCSKRLKNRLDFLEQYIIFLTQAHTMINFGAMSVKEILLGIKSVPLVEPLLKDTANALENGLCIENAWKSSVDTHTKKFGFQKSDTEMLYFFGNTFGVSDISGELTKIKLHTELVSNRADTLRQEFVSKQKIYRISGMFGGVLTAILLC